MGFDDDDTQVEDTSEKQTENELNTNFDIEPLSNIPPSENSVEASLGSTLQTSILSSFGKNNENPVISESHTGSTSSVNLKESNFRKTVLEKIDFMMEKIIYEVTRWYKRGST